MKIIAFDFETGGLSPDRHAITQLALVACVASGGTVIVPTQDRSEVGRFVRVWAVKPDPRLMIEEEALRIQGHNRGTLHARPNQLTESQLVAEIQAFFAGLPDGWETAPLVAHNAKFDHGFLTSLCHRQKAPLLPRHAICTVERQRELVRRKLIAKGENNKLATLAKLIGHKQAEAHDALEDTKLCAGVFAWQEKLLASSGNLIDDKAEDTVGIVFRHEPSALDDWWTKHGEEFPAKAPAHPLGKVCAACGQPAQWRRPYRLGARIGAGFPPMHQFFCCAACKANDASISDAIGLSGDEVLTWAGEWFELILTPPTAKIAGPKPATAETPRPVFSVSKELCELHRKAKDGALTQVPGFTSRSGEIEDANRFVVGAFRNILNTLEDLEKLAKVQQKQNQNV